MIRVNLLPHREEKRKARRIQFYAMSGLVAALAALIFGFGYLTLSRMVSAQEEKNKFLTKEIASLDNDIKEIKNLEQRKKERLDRNQVIENLQSVRNETVHLFNELIRRVPEGIYLKTVKQTGRKISLNGYAQANSRVSELMQQLDQSPLLEKPVLIEIRAATVDRRRLSEFNLTVELTSAQVQTGDKNEKGKKPAAGKANP